MGTNTGATVLDPVVITDNLSAVLNNATYNGDAVATIDGELALSGTTLTWTGSLEPGESVKITYSVTVKADAYSKVLKNVVTGEATPPGVPSITPPPSETEHKTPPAPPVTPKPPLPGTGASVGTAAALAALLLLGGGAAVVVTRRRNDGTIAE